jgi:uronate dehydrogenase
MKKILITGAAGQIGRALRAAWQGKYWLRLSDIAALSPAGTNEECVQADIADLAAVEKLMSGIDAVAHFGGHAIEGTWEQLLPPNIIGVYNILEAARRKQVQRVILASSNHAVGFYRREKVLDSNHQPRPDGLYGVTKAFCEAIGSMYADKHGMTVACLRIGTFKNPDCPDSERHLMTWISHRDLVHLVKRCIEAPDYHFAIVYGLSKNTRGRWDNSKVAQLGYRPQDDAETYAAQILGSAAAEDPLAKQFHGGFYVPVDFTGDASKIP